MARRKTVAIPLAKAPDENDFEDAEIVRKKWSSKTTEKQLKKMAEDFHAFLYDNVDARFYDALQALFAETGWA